MNKTYKRKQTHKPKKNKDERDNTPVQQPTRRTSRAVADLRLYTPTFHASTRRKLMYHEEELAFTSTSGVPSGYVFSANGLFDPNITGTGHQPVGFDQLMQYYEQYTVVASKATVDLLNSNTTAISRCVLYLSPDAAILTDPNRVIENGLCVTKVAYPNVTWNSVAQLNLDCNIAEYFGRTNTLRELLNDTSLFGTAAANPIEQVYYVMSAWDPFGTNTLGYFANITIEYDVVFWEPRKLVES